MNSDQRSSRSWAWSEFGHAKLGDRRRRRRVQQLAQRLTTNAAPCVSEVCSDAAERQGAYDLLESGKLSADALCDSMASACVERGGGAPYVFVPIDGSSVQIVDRRRQHDFGAVGSYKNGARGLQVISAIALAPEGTPLGVVAQEWWTRPTTRPRRKSRSTYRPLEERETRFYTQAIDKVVDRYAGTGTTPWIVVDRGGDATEILHRLVNSGARFTVRASWNRRLIATTQDAKYLRARLPQAPVVGGYVVNVPAGYQRQARRARMLIRTATVTLNLSHDWRAKRKNIELNVVWARELEPPHGEKPLDWMLFTNHRVASLADALLVIDSYTKRWRIEDFHKTWKTGGGCVEQMKLRSTSAAKTWATLHAAVAIRTERLKHLARTQPEQSAAIELTAPEIEVLVVLKRREAKRNESIPDAPSIAQAVRWLADLGGYVGNSNSGPPGSITIGRGLKKIRVAVELLEALRASGKIR